VSWYELTSISLVPVSQQIFIRAKVGKSPPPSDRECCHSKLPFKKFELWIQKVSAVKPYHVQLNELQHHDPRNIFVQHALKTLPLNRSSSDKYDVKHASTISFKRRLFDFA